MSWTLIIIADGTRSMATIPGFQSEDVARAAGSKAVEEEVSFARYRVVEVPGKTDSKVIKNLDGSIFDAAAFEADRQGADVEPPHEGSL